MENSVGSLRMALMVRALCVLGTGESELYIVIKLVVLHKTNSMFVAMQFSIIARVHNYVVLISSSVYMKQTALW